MRLLLLFLLLNGCTHFNQFKATDRIAKTQDEIKYINYLAASAPSLGYKMAEFVGSIRYSQFKLDRELDAINAYYLDKTIRRQSCMEAPVACKKMLTERNNKYHNKRKKRVINDYKSLLASCSKIDYPYSTACETLTYNSLNVNKELDHLGREIFIEKYNDLCIENFGAPCMKDAQSWGTVRIPINP